MALSNPLRALVVFAAQNHQVSEIAAALRSDGHHDLVLERVDTAEGMSAALARETWDLVIADPSLVQFSGTDVLQLLAKSGTAVPVILATEKSVHIASHVKILNRIATISPQDGKAITAFVREHIAPPGTKSKQESTAAMLRYLAEYDPLTGLPNRHLFHESLQKVINKSPAEPFAVVILGLDRFRDINHVLGPNCGDLLLKQAAHRFERKTGTAFSRARLGGDEFAAIVAHRNDTDTQTACAAILKSLAKPFIINDIPIDMSGSIGVAVFPEHGDDANQIFQRANIALDTAKQSGTGYGIYSPADDPYTQQKLAYLGGLRNAIEQDQLVLYYQPKIDLRTGHTMGVEALVRWDYPKVGLIPPYQFIGVAERTGLIHRLSRWVIKTALDQCSVWHRAGLLIPVAINLSPRNLHDATLPTYIARMIKERHLPPELLEVEITENVIMTDAKRVWEVLSVLKDQGVNAYIDDFGTGYSSLGHLKKLPVSGIKIDRSFVAQMITEENDNVIVRSTIDLGHNLGLHVIAEGVETLEVLNRLQSLGCDAAQGYFMSRPKPAKELDEWLAQSQWGIHSSSLTHEQLTDER